MQQTQKRETVGKISSDLIQKPLETKDAIEQTNAMLENYPKDIEKCVFRGKNLYPGEDFFVVVIQKQERLMKNVIRSYFFPRRTCPTPNYDQIVYKYTLQNDQIDLIWVIPNREMSIDFVRNRELVPPQAMSLLKYILDFEDGSLTRRMKELNKEEDLITGVVVYKKTDTTENLKENHGR